MITSTFDPLNPTPIYAPSMLVPSVCTTQNAEEFRRVRGSITSTAMLLWSASARPSGSQLECIAEDLLHRLMRTSVAGVGGWKRADIGLQAGDVVQHDAGAVRLHTEGTQCQEGS